MPPKSASGSRRANGGGHGNNQGGISSDATSPAPAKTPKDSASALGLSQVLRSLEHAVKTSNLKEAEAIIDDLRAKLASEQRRDWSAETEKIVFKRKQGLWKATLAAFQGAQPDLQAKCCRIIELLGQTCKSCLSGDFDALAQGDAPDKVVSAMEDNPNHLGVVGAGTRALLSLAGCLACKCYHDRPTQNTLGENGAVEALVSAASFFLSHPLVEAARDLPPEDRGTLRQLLRDALHALHFLCLNNLENTDRLGEAGGFSVLLEALESDPCDPELQAHGCVVLCELASRDDVSPVEIKECLDILLDRLQQFRDDREASAALVWSLSRLLSLTVKSPLTYDMDSEELGELWAKTRLLGIPASLDIMLSLDAEYLKTEDGKTLLKHIMDLIAVVAPRMRSSPDTLCPPTPPHEGHAHGSSLPPVSAASQEAVLCRQLDELYEVIRNLALRNSDLWVQSVAVRTLYFILCNPEVQACAECADRELRALLPGLLSSAQALRTRYAKPNKETFTFHIYALAVLQMLKQRTLTEDVRAPAAHTTQPLQPQPQHPVAAFLAQVNGGAGGGGAASGNRGGAAQPSKSAAPAGSTPSKKKSGSPPVPTAPSAEDLAAAGAAGFGVDLSPFVADLHTCTEYALRYLDSELRQEEDFDYDLGSINFSEDGEDDLDTGCCKYGWNCLHLHESVKGAEVLRAVEAVARGLISTTSGLEGINSTHAPDGMTILHRLAQAGIAEGIEIVFRLCGPRLDLLKRAKSGANALQLARQNKHRECMQLLERTTEEAALRAQELLLQELVGGDGAAGGEGSAALGGASPAVKGKKKEKEKDKDKAPPTPPPPKLSKAEQARLERQANEAAVQRAAEERRRLQEERAAEYERALEARRVQLELEQRRESERRRREAEAARREREEAEGRRRREEEEMIALLASVEEVRLGLESPVSAGPGPAALPTLLAPALPSVVAPAEAFGPPVGMAGFAPPLRMAAPGAGPWGMGVSMTAEPCAADTTLSSAAFYSAFSSGQLQGGAMELGLGQGPGFLRPTTPPLAGLLGSHFLGGNPADGLSLAGLLAMGGAMGQQPPPGFNS